MLRWPGRDARKVDRLMRRAGTHFDACCKATRACAMPADVNHAGNAASVLKELARQTGMRDLGQGNRQRDNRLQIWRKCMIKRRSMAVGLYPRSRLDALSDAVFGV